MNLKIKTYLVCWLLIILSCTSSYAQYTVGSVFSAARGGDLKIVSQKLKDISDQETLNNILGAGVAGNQPEIIDLLIQKGADINQRSSWDTPIINHAIMNELYVAAETLINAGANLEAYGFRRKAFNIFTNWNWTPLMCAAYKGNVNLVKLLLKKGADPSALGYSNSPDEAESAADIAAYSGHLEIVKLLSKKKVKSNPDTIFKTVRGGYLETFKYLLKDEKDINRIGPHNKTLLMEAAWWGHYDIVEYLLDKKAKINLTNADGHSALIEAVNNPDRNIEDQLEVVKLLIARKADINAVTNDQKTVLDIAQENKLRTLLPYLKEIYPAKK